MRRYHRVTYLVWPTCLLAIALGAQDTPRSASASPTTDRTCSLPGLSAVEKKTFADAQLLAAYNAQAGLVRSLRAYAMVRGEGGKEYGRPAKQPRGIAATIQFQSPALVRMTGIIPFSESRGFDMASNGRDFRLLVPVDREMRFLVGSVDAPTDSSNPRENLRPQPLIDALRWPSGTPMGTTSAPAADRAVRILSIQLPPLGGEPRTGQVEFDLRSGTVSSLSIYGPGARLISEVRYIDWEEVANQSTGAAPACYPRRIALVQPKEDIQLDMRILQLDLNPAIPAARFLLNPPKGVPVVKLSSSGAKGAP